MTSPERLINQPASTVSAQARLEERQRDSAVLNPSGKWPLSRCGRFGPGPTRAASEGFPGPRLGRAAARPGRAPHAGPRLANVTGRSWKRMLFALCFPHSVDLAQSLGEDGIPGPGPESNKCTHTPKWGPPAFYSKITCSNRLDLEERGADTYSATRTRRPRRRSRPRPLSSMRCPPDPSRSTMGSNASFRYPRRG